MSSIIQPQRMTAVEHQPQHLMTIFDHLFAESENTRLILGGDEPIYIPAGSECDYHQVVFAHGYFSSALHEIAHWCIAGKARRLLLDYGYWYAPDGRSQQQQQAFEQVEVKPQAVEWILSNACNKRFRVSADNLSGEATDPGDFKRAVYQQVLAYCDHGLPVRALQLRQQLCAFFKTPLALNSEQFKFTEID